MVSKLVMIKVLSTNEPPIEPSQILWLTQQKELNKIKLRRVMPCLEKSAQVATDDPITVSSSKKWVMFGRVISHIRAMKNHITLRDYGCVFTMTS